jgi:hypothetical protein
MKFQPGRTEGAFVVSGRFAYLIVLVLFIFLAVLLVFAFMKTRRGGAELFEHPAAADTVDFTSDSNRIEVTLFFPGRGGGRLRPEKREIFDTRTDTSKAKQVISELIAGPETSGLLPVLSPETRIRNLYLSTGGTAYLDFSGELVRDCPSGTTGEIQTVYAVVNALTYNFITISRVKILVEGREILTLKGHLDLRRLFTQNRDIVDWRIEDYAEDWVEAGKDEMNR